MPGKQRPANPARHAGSGRRTFPIFVTLVRQVLTRGQNLLCCLAFVAGGLGHLSWQSAALAGELRGSRQDSTESDRVAIV